MSITYFLRIVLFFTLYISIKSSCHCCPRSKESKVQKELYPKGQSITEINWNVCSRCSSFLHSPTKCKLGWLATWSAHSPSVIKDVPVSFHFVWLVLSSITVHFQSSCSCSWQAWQHVMYLTKSLIWPLPSSFHTNVGCLLANSLNSHKVSSDSDCRILCVLPRCAAAAGKWSFTIA